MKFVSKVILSLLLFSAFFLVGCDDEETVEACDSCKSEWVERCNLAQQGTIVNETGAGGANVSGLLAQSDCPDWAEGQCLAQCDGVTEIPFVRNID